MSDACTLSIRYSYRDVPTCARFARSDAFIRGLMGPVGSGKSSASVIEIIRRAQATPKSKKDGIRHSRWAVVRNTYSELKLTTIKTVMQWLPDMQFGRYVAQNHTYTVTAIPGCRIEIIFLALDRPADIKKLLSLELTGAWVNEAREVPWAVIEALQGRVGRFPRLEDTGPFWYGVWMDTNPPEADSKWYGFYEDKHWIRDFNRLKEEGIFPSDMPPEGYAEMFQQPGGMSPNAENLSNLQPGYYQKISIGKAQEWVKVYVDGQYGFVVEGKLIFPEYIDSIHCKAVDPVPGLTIVRGWDFGLCYSADTEVLTNHGWKLFKDVDEVNDLAASRDPSSGRMAFTPIAFKIAKPFKGDLLEWSSTEVNMLVTPEHRVPYTNRDSPGQVRWESAEWLADHMGSHHYVDLLSEWEEPADAPTTLWGMPAPVFARLMGLFLSEGSATDKVVNIYQQKSAHLIAIGDMLRETGLDWRRFDHISERKTVGGWRLYDPGLAALLFELGNQHRRRIPAVVRHLGRAALLAFIDAYTLGDGHRRTRPNGSEEHTLFTASADMASDFQEIAQKVGWNSSVRWRRPQVSTIIEAGVPREITNSGGWDVAFKKRASRAELLKRNFKRVPYDGVVYCLNVPWHTLYVRRNGRPHWNGNTPACSFSQLQPTGQWLTFDEMTSDNMSIDRFADEVLTKCTRSFRGGDIRFEDWGDPAGAQRAQTDMRTCFEIMRSKKIMVEPSIQEPRRRQEAMRSMLQRPSVDWEPTFILHPRCKVLRKGFMGGYHRRRLSVAGPERYSEEPQKNFYSHVNEGHQYAVVQYFDVATGQTEGDDDDYPHGDFDVEIPRDSSTGY